jgi:SAM-dependent methyltransferase
MTPAIQNWIKENIAVGVIPSKGKICEVGAYNVNGSIRQFFRQEGYVGVDMTYGPGVDIVADAHCLEFDDHTFDVVICLEMLEHDTKPWITVAHLHRILKPGGTLLISVPTNGFPEHKYPLDLFRYLPDAFTHFFFEGMNILSVDTVSSIQNEYTLIGVARKR